jgi:hypothetical protein
MELSDTYIRVTLDQPVTEQQEKIISLAVNEYVDNELSLLEGEEDIFEGLVFETEEGHSIEFPLTEDLKDHKVEQICSLLSEYIENFTVEASGAN